jgi:hypothetical protein
MIRIPYVVGFAFCAGTLAVQPAAAQALSLADMTIAGVPLGADTAAVRRALGVPRWKHPVIDDDGVHLSLWSYSGIEVNFDTTGHAYVIFVRSRKFRTRRGVRVGDPADTVRSRYGLQATQELPDRVLLYELAPGDDMNQLGIQFVLIDGRVKSIIIGHVVSVE